MSIHTHNQSTFAQASKMEQAEYLRDLIGASFGASIPRGKDARWWKEKLTQYELAISLGTPNFLTMNANGKSGVLTALVQAGIAHRFSSLGANNPNIALQYWTDTLKLGKTFFSELPLEGKNQILSALIHSGNEQLSIEKNDLEKAKDFYKQVEELAEPIFDILDAEGQALVATASNRTGYLYQLGKFGNSGPKKALKHYEKTIQLLSPKIDNQNLSISRQLYSATYSAARVIQQISNKHQGYQNAVQILDQYISKYNTNLEQLETEIASLVLTAECEIAYLHLYANEDKLALKKYIRVQRKVKSIVKKKGVSGYQYIAPYLWNNKQRIAQTNDIKQLNFAKSVALKLSKIGIALFPQLNAKSQSLVLEFMFQSGFIESKLQSIHNDSTRSSRVFRDVVNYGLPIFDDLTFTGRIVTIKSLLLNSIDGTSSHSTNASLESHKNAIKFLRPFIEKTEPEALNSVFRGLIELANDFKKKQPKNRDLYLALAILCHQEVIDLGAPQFMLLNHGGKSAVIESLFFHSAQFCEDLERESALLVHQKAITLAGASLSVATPRETSWIVNNLVNACRAYSELPNESLGREFAERTHETIFDYFDLAADISTYNSPYSLVDTIFIPFHNYCKVGEWHQSEKSYKKAIDKIKEIFPKIPNGQREQTFSSLLANAQMCKFGSAKSGPRVKLALSFYLDIIGIGISLIDKLGIKERATLLQPLFEAAECHEILDFDQNGQANAKALYEKLINLGMRDFDWLLESGNGYLIRAIFKVVTDTNEFFSANGEEKSIFDIINLIKSRFHTLDGYGKSNVLACLNGACHPFREHGKDGSHRNLLQKSYQEVVGLGLPNFKFLNASGQRSLIEAMLHRSLIYCELEEWGNMIASYQDVTAIIELRSSNTNHWDPEAIASVLFNSAREFQKLQPNFMGRDQALRCYKDAFQHCLTHYNFITNKSILFTSLLESTNISYNSNNAISNGDVCIALFLSNRASFDAIKRLEVFIGNGVGLRWIDTQLATERWLTCGDIPLQTNPKKSKHAQTILRSARASLAMQVRLKWPYTAAACAAQRRWPIKFWSLGHWVLGHLAAHAPDLLPNHPSEASTWMPDIERIASVLNIKEMNLGNGLYRAPYYLATLCPIPLVDEMRLPTRMGDSLELNVWLSAFDIGDKNPFSTALVNSWRILGDGIVTPIANLSNWLLVFDRDDFQFPHVWKIARDAVLLARCDELIQNRWEGTGLKSKEKQPFRGSINFALTELSEGGPARSDGERALLKSLWQGAKLTLALEMSHYDSSSALHLRLIDLNAIWEALAMTYVGLASPITTALGRATGSNIRQGWDDSAIAAIREVEQVILQRARMHSAAAASGEILPHPEDLNEPLEPFATYAAEWRRMGFDLRVPSPEEAARTLAPGQALVQVVCLSGDVAPQALVLSRPLPDSATGAQAKNWALTLERFSPDEANEAGLAELMRRHQESLRQAASHTTYFDAWQHLWQSLTEPNGRANAFMTWLNGFGPTGVIAILPHDWSAAPWQAAWANNLPQAPALTLVASVDAWVQSRKSPQPASNSDGPVLAKPSVVISLDLLPGGGAFESAELSQALSVTPKQSNDLADVIAALEKEGPTHLAMHAEFQAEDPMRSALVVDKRQSSAVRGRDHAFGWGRMLRKGDAAQWADDAAIATAPEPQEVQEVQEEIDQPFAEARLPVWVLRDLKIKGDISLAACETMAQGTGAGDAQHLGPIGMGPVLMAGGARSVVGSLWPCDDWAAAVFFACWYAERRTLSAAQALQRSRERLCDLDEAAFLAWVQRVDPGSLPAAEQRCQLARAVGWASPFSHPWCWAGFALLGDAPTLPWLQKIEGPGAKLAWWRRLSNWWVARFRKTQRPGN